MKIEKISYDSGTDIAKDIRTRVADLNDLIATANTIGLDVEIERVDSTTLGSRHFILQVRVLQPL